MVAKVLVDSMANNSEPNQTVCTTLSYALSWLSIGKTNENRFHYETNDNRALGDTQGPSG